MTKKEFESLPCFSVEHDGIAYDDARNSNGVWYYRHPATKEILRVLSNRLVVLHENEDTKLHGSQKLSDSTCVIHKMSPPVEDGDEGTDVRLKEPHEPSPDR